MDWLPKPGISGCYRSGGLIRGPKYRCHELGILSTDAYRALFRHYKDAGWRDPPYELHRLDPERPKRFERPCYRAFSEGLISESKAAELLEVAIPELESRLQQAGSPWRPGRRRLPTMNDRTSGKPGGAGH